MTLIALLVVSALCFITEMVYLSRRGEALRSASRAAHLSHAAMLNQQTGLRGFVVTHDKKFLDSYQLGRYALAEQLDYLLTDIEQYPDLARDLMGVRLQEQSWTAYASETIAGKIVADLDRDRLLFESYRARQIRLEQQIDARLEGLVRVRAELLASAGVLQVILFAIAMVAGRRHLRRLQSEIGLPVSSVVAAIQGVRMGTLLPVQRQPGPAELADIQEGLDEMIASLTSERATRELRTREVSARAAELRQILDSAREFSGSLNLRYVLRTLGQASKDVAGARRAVVWLLDDVGTQLRSAFDSEATEGIPVGMSPLEIGSGLVGRAARYARTLTPDARPGGGQGDAPLVDVQLDQLAVPLIVGARVIGVLQLFDGGTGGLPSDRREILEVLASHGAAAIESARLHQTVEERSHRDALTKLYNRRRLEEDLETELNRSRRYKSPLSFVMLDVDHFKRFNDTFGHGKGDEILEELGHVLEATVRNTDTAYRYGGEEFSIVLRETAASGAAEFGERLRRRIETHFGSVNGAGPVTSSIGVATFSPDMRGPAALVEAADAALYEAKRCGRNQVCSATMGMVARSAEPLVADAAAQLA